MFSKAPALFAEPELCDGGQFSADLVLGLLTRTKKEKNLGPDYKVPKCFDKASIV